MEGFERYIESLFGPGGVYDDQGGVGNILGSLLQRPKRRAHPPGLNSEKLSAMDQQFDAASHFRDEPQVTAPPPPPPNAIYCHFRTDILFFILFLNRCRCR